MKKLYNNQVITTYFLLQPIIDIITGLMKFYFNIPLSLAMIIRFLFIIYAGVYIIKSKDKKVYLFMFIWVLYCAVSLIGNYYLKDNFRIMHHIYNLFRLAYFQITLLFFYRYFKENKSLDNKVFTKMGFIVGASLIFSLITKTSFCSYDEFENCLPKGYLGYFFSANEYGSILIALLGYQIIELLKNKKLINYIVLLMLVFFLAVLGTKTSIISLYGLLIVFIIYHIISLFFDKSKKENNRVVVVLFVILALVTLNIKRLPIYNNLYEIYFGTMETKQTENPEISEEDLQTEVNSYLVFSGRADFVRVNKAIYKEASIFHKLFGMTDQGNYYEGELVSHINERDFHDLYMIYGIVGLIVELLLPVSLFVGIIKRILKNLKVLLNNEVVILGCLLLLLLAIGYMAGHSLMHPAVAFYIAYIIADLLKRVDSV